MPQHRNSYITTCMSHVLRPRDWSKNHLPLPGMRPSLRSHWYTWSACPLRPFAISPRFIPLANEPGFGKPLHFWQGHVGVTTLWQCYMLAFDHATSSHCLPNILLASFILLPFDLCVHLIPGLMVSKQGYSLILFLFVLAENGCMNYAYLIAKSKSCNFQPS